MKKQNERNNQNKKEIMILIHKDIDYKLGTYIIGRHKNKNNINISRYNILCILFKEYKQVVKGMYEKYSKVQDFKIYNLPNSDFWKKVKNDFIQKKETITFEVGHNGNVRKALYLLGQKYGYIYTVKGQKRYEKTSTRTRLIYAEDSIDLSKLYTIQYLRHKRLDWGKDYQGKESWLSTDQRDDKGRVLYRFNPEASPYKRGIMTNTPGVITFNILIRDLRSRIFVLSLSL